MDVILLISSEGLVSILIFNTSFMLLIHSGLSLNSPFRQQNILYIDVKSLFRGISISNLVSSKLCIVFLLLSSLLDRPLTYSLFAVSLVAFLERLFSPIKSLKHHAHTCFNQQIIIFRRKAILNKLTALPTC